jgi:ubiquinone/menaquinone biosynthesis C-methylase UbiE
MNNFDYEKFYEKVGEKIGWNFSRINKIVEGRKWIFTDEVKKILKTTDVLLDIGTGGGEKILKLARYVRKIIAIDHSPNMIKTANENLSELRYENVEFKRMNAFDLKFKDSYFEIVTARHCDFSPKEVYRVLKDNGHFMTQQVSKGDKINIKQAFKRGQSYDKESGNLMNKYVFKLKEIGFKDIQTKTYNATEYYKTEKDLIFLLKYTPIIPDFGKNKKDFEKLKKFIRDNKNAKGIETNAERFMITATK